MSDRHLSAILHADVVGYSELTATDEEKTLKALRESLDLFSSLIAGFGGEKINEAGDALLAEFASVTAAVECGVGFQQKMFAANEQDAFGLNFQYRIGIHLGEVNKRDNDIYLQPLRQIATKNI